MYRDGVTHEPLCEVHCDEIISVKVGYVGMKFSEVQKICGLGCCVIDGEISWDVSCDDSFGIEP